MKMSFAVKRAGLWIFFCLFTLTESVFMNGPQKSQQSQLENVEGTSSSRHLYEKRKRSDEFEASSSSEFERRESSTALAEVIPKQQTMKRQRRCKDYCKKLISTTHNEPSRNFWVEFIALANDCGALNLAQGFTDMPIPEFLGRNFEAVLSDKENAQLHQYTRGYGHKRLVEILAKLYSKFMDVNIDPETDILVTIGAYNALHNSFLAWIKEGDEVLIIEPSYDSYPSQIKLAGGVPVYVPLNFDANARTSADFHIDFDLLRSKITPKTKMLVLTSPNNPIGKLYTRSELEELARIVKDADLLVLADEVHEWSVYSGHQRMIKFGSLPGMYERTITTGSAGKAFTTTGWRVGWAIAPKNLLERLKRVHERGVFMCCTPTQEALARTYEEEFGLIEKGKLSQSYLLGVLPQQLLQKRNYIASQLESAGFKTILPESGLFITFDISHLNGPFKTEGTCYRRKGEGVDFGFARWLCKEKQLALIPLSAFKSPENRGGDDDHYIRLCFFKRDETLEKAVSILKSLAPRN